MRPDLDVCRDPDLLAAEVRRLRAVVAAGTNHDAAPAARAESDEDRTDKAATSHRRDGTGDTPSSPYRHPPCHDSSQKNLTLTDAEREAIAELRNDVKRLEDKVQFLSRSLDRHTGRVE